MTPAPANRVRYRIGDLVVDVGARRVTREGAEIRLPKLSFDLLLALVERAPNVVSIDELMAAVWPGVVVGEDTVTQRVKLLRDALGGDVGGYVATLRGSGYRLVPQVEVLADRANGSARSRGGRRGRAVLRVVVPSLLVAGLAAGWWWQQDSDERRSGAERHAIAVLPFANLSPDEGREYFSDGIHEEVIARLSQIGSLRVTSRTSVMPYRDSEKSVREIARELGVGSILEGSVRYAADRIRVTAQLIDPGQDRHVWSETYERAFSVQDVFAIQSDVARQITAQLQAELTPEESVLIERLATESTAAYDLYLRGLHHHSLLTPDNLRAGIGFLQQAIALDPRFARAHERLGWIYGYAGTTDYGWMKPAAAFELAKRHALIALALDDTAATAHELLASILYWYEWDAIAAEPAYLRAIALDPGSFSVYTGYAYFLSAEGRHDEAIATVKKAIAAAPNNKNVYTNAGWRYLCARRYDDARRSAGRSLEMVPDFKDAHTITGWVYAYTGQLERAIESFRTSQARGGLGYALARAGRTREARAHLAEMQHAAESEYISPSSIAVAYIGLGELDRAIDWLEKSVAERSRDALFFDVLEVYDPLRGRPRFDALLDRVTQASAE